MIDPWCPFAVKAPVRGHEAGAGGFTGGGWKAVWHTTEGDSYAGAFATYGVTGNLPHFTADVSKGSLQLWQHLPLDVAASALKHPTGTGETNHDDAIQIEIVGFAAQSGDWPIGAYTALAVLARWLEANCGVERRSYNGARFEWPVWHRYSGHCGHIHVPNNDHTDPGALFRWQDLVAAGAAPQPSPDPPTPEHALTMIIEPVSTVDRPGHPGQGWAFGRRGHTYAFGDGCPNFGGAPDGGNDDNFVALVPTLTGNGYWMIRASGNAYSYGDAQFYGNYADHPDWDQSNQHLAIVGAIANERGGYTFIRIDCDPYSFPLT